MSALAINRWRVAVAAIAVMAVALRLAAAGHSLWFDEQAAVFYTWQPLAQLWSDWMVREPNPPLYYTLLKGWIALAGTGDIAVRVPSILMSGAVVAIIGGLAGRLYGPRAAIIAAVLAAVSSQQLYYAEQARGYIFGFATSALATAAALDIALRLDAPRPPRGALTLYAIGAMLSIYLHTTFLLLPPILFLAVLATRLDLWPRRPSALLPFALANLVVLAAAGWWIRLTFLQLGRSQGTLAANGQGSLGEVARRAASLFQSRMAHGPAAPLVAAILFLLAAWFVARDWRRRETRFLFAVLAIGVGLFALLNLRVPIFTNRTIFWLSLPPLLFAAAALARIADARWRILATTIVCGLLALNMLGSLGALESEDWNTPARTIARAPGALLLVQGEAMGVAMRTECTRLLRTCPDAVAVLMVPGDDADGWANGLFPDTKIGLDQIDGLPAERPIYLFRKESFHDPLESMHAAGKARALDWHGARLLGPVPAAALR